jgi:lysophospholipase L1-like esterase
MKKFRYFLLSFTIFFIIFFLIFDYYLKKNNPRWHTFDKELGWKIRENFDYTYKQITSRGIPYKVDYKTNNIGLRYNNDNEKNLKDIDVLVIGDSFTADPYSSNDLMWYSILTNELSLKFNKKINVLSGGGGGYANTQQLILTNKLKDLIKPKIFILQFCVNDFGANVFEIEKNGTFNQYIYRPFLINNEFVFESSFVGKILRTKFIANSKILGRILYEFTLWKNKRPKNKEYLKNKEQLTDISVEKTSSILNRIRNNFPDSKSFMVNCDITNEYPNSLWKEIAIKNNFVPLENGNLIINQNTDKDIWFSDGGHFNDYGNELFGKGTYEEMIEHLESNIF